MHKKTILELHDDLINKRVTSSELFESSLNHLKRINDNYNLANSYCEITEDVEINNVLAGIPYGMKDLVATKDILTTSSSKILSNFKPKYNAVVYSRLCDANAAMLCKTNLDEFGVGGTNENSVNGYSRNPHNIDFTTGGSSGGSAGLVASGCVPYAIGSDTGDSTRKPAAFCGIYGFKPTWSVIPRYGVYPYATSFDQIGVFARCIDDIAIVVEQTNGACIEDSTSLPHEKEMFYQNLKACDKPLKVGYIKELIDTFDNEVVVKQFNETIEYIKSLGHEVVELHLDIDLLRTIRGTYQVLVNAEGASNLSNLSGIPFGVQILKDNVKDSIVATRSEGLSKYTKGRHVIGAMALKAENQEKYLMKAKKIRRIMIDECAKLFNETPIIVAPSSNTNSFDPTIGQNAKTKDGNLVAENHLSLTNLIGAAGLSIPTHYHEGMPYGVSFMAKPFDDQLLLNFGKQFENGLLKDNYLNLQSFYNVYKEVE